MSVEELIGYLTGQQAVPGSHPVDQTLADLMTGGLW